MELLKKINPFLFVYSKTIILICIKYKSFKTYKNENFQRKCKSY